MFPLNLAVDDEVDASREIPCHGPLGDERDERDRNSRRRPA